MRTRAIWPHPVITTWLPLIFPKTPPNPVIFAPTVVFSSLLVWFLGGGTRAATWGKPPFLHIAPPADRPQITFNSSRMITIRIIRLIPPPP
jgi:hypothetical protein